MRIVRSLEGRARLAVAAGFQLGARPAAQAPCQRDLFSTLTHRAFASVLDQAAHAGCQALVCGGGLFAAPLPSLEDVRAAMAPLGSARRAGISIIATSDQPGQATDGTSFLAEVGLIDAVLDAQGPASVLAPAANLHVALVTGGGQGGVGEADLIIALAAPGSDDTVAPAALAGFADVVIDTRTLDAGSERVNAVPVIATGWAGPALDRSIQPGFVVLDLDSGAGVAPTFMETEALRPAQLVIDSPQAGREVARMIEPHLGAAAILDVELRGRIVRSAWHDVDPAGLIERAAAAGTLLRFAIDRLVVDESEHEARAPERLSFLVNARRVSERLATAAGDGTQRSMITAARAHVVEIARRREPTKAVT